MNFNYKAQSEYINDAIGDNKGILLLFVFNFFFQFMFLFFFI